MNFITNYKQKSLALTLASIVGLTSFNAIATTYSISGNFIMFDGTGAQVGTTDNTLSGTFDDTDPTALNAMEINSSQPFFGILWDAHDLVIDQTSGLKSYDTVQAGNLTGNVNNGQWIIHMLFDWGVTYDIDVINVWNVEADNTGTIRLTSTDVDTTGTGTIDGILGAPMVDGPFLGFSANFNLTLTPPFLTDLTTSQGGGVTTSLDAAGGNITIDSGVSDATSYDWSASDAALVAAATGGTSNQTLVIDPLALDGNYTARVTVTSSGDSLTVPLSFTVTSFNFSAIDTDGDGVNDDVEGAGDSDGDGIPDFLDNSTLPATSMQLSSGATMTTDQGALVIGSLVSTRGVASLSTNASNPELAASAFLPELSIDELGVDNKVISSCVGGCYEFRVRSLANGSTANVVIPLSAEIPANAVYRKSSNGNWKGFKVDDINNIASAPASSTGPTVCPAADSTMYTQGLTQGHYCVRLTINDGGANDADGQANGTIVDPGGIASTDQSNLEDSSYAIDGVGGGWWFLMSLPALVGLRRYTAKK